MHALNRNLIALALGAVLVSPAAFAQKDKSAEAGTRASDAVSNKTTERETDATATTTPTSATGATSTSATTQSAKASSPGKGNWWKDADSDADGKLNATEAESNAGLSSRFSTIDADKDGFVTTEEYRQFYTANASQGAENAAGQSAVVSRDLWVKLDADADSRISLAEAAANADLTGSFTTMDSNADGFVTQAEYTAYAKLQK